MSHDSFWLESSKQIIDGYRKMIDGAVQQLSDEQFFARPKPEMHSVAVLLRHMGGNLQSRWTNFLTEDGEKSTRDRDAEFEDWPDSRDALIAYFDAGWSRLSDAVVNLTEDDVSRTVFIRGEPHSVPSAILRTLTHISYHVGQLLLVSRLVYDDDATWRWLTIRPGGSQEHNESTWGTAASRGVAGERDQT